MKKYAIIFLIILLSALFFLTILIILNDSFGDSKESSLNNSSFEKNNTTQSICPDKSYVYPNYPNWEITLDECDWVADWKSQNMFSAKNIQDNSEINIKFTVLQGVGFNGNCYNKNYSFISSDLVRVEESLNKFSYGNREDFITNEDPNFQDIIVEGNNDSNASYTYCNNVFLGFTTQTLDQKRALVEISADTNNPNLTDQVVKTMKY